VEDLAAVRARRRYTFSHQEPGGTKIEFALCYDKRLGIGANPYDNEDEDVDLFALIASGVRAQPFFRNYTQE
jgi:hypothetical protein